nr:unnamed protein product [Callosobruchus analis]
MKELPHKIMLSFPQKKPTVYKQELANKCAEKLEEKQKLKTLSAPELFQLNHKNINTEEVPFLKRNFPKKSSDEEGYNTYVDHSGDLDDEKVEGSVKADIKFSKNLKNMKMWISFMIPKIEDGNNFGVSVQEDTLAEVQSVESEAAAFFDQISRRAVQELDEKEYLSLWLVMSEIRNRR